MAQDERDDNVVIQGHNYDGIREYDNPMPGWWVWIFVATVVFAPVYVLGVHVFGFIPTYEDDLARSQAELQAVRAANESSSPSFEADPAALAAVVQDPTSAEAGAALFATSCAACHGAQGQGLIGPNLADAYWIHGNTNADMYRVITQGVVEKGMTPWGSILSPQQRAELVAFIRSLEGTNPPGAKEPQGELHASD